MDGCAHVRRHGHRGGEERTIGPSGPESEAVGFLRRLIENVWRLERRPLLLLAPANGADTPDESSGVTLAEGPAGSSAVSSAMPGPPPMETPTGEVSARLTEVPGG